MKQRSEIKEGGRRQTEEIQLEVTKVTRRQAGSGLVHLGCVVVQLTKVKLAMEKQISAARFDSANGKK